MDWSDPETRPHQPAPPAPTSRVDGGLWLVQAVVVVSVLLAIGCCLLAFWLRQGPM